MLAWLLKRSVALVLTLFVIAVGSFALLRAAPGGPFDSERSLPPEVERELMRYYGLDRPAFFATDALSRGEVGNALIDTQFGRWLRGLLHGDLGPSFQYKGRRVQEVLAAGAAASAALGLLALGLAVGLGIGLGAWAAARRGGRADRFVLALTAAGIAVPNFVIGVLLASIFGVTLRLFPLGGWGSPLHLILPATALMVPHAAAIARLMRSSLLETLGKSFCRTARAKGLSETEVIVGHALRPALAPVVQYLGPATASLVTGSLAIEAIFNVPGMGAHFVNAALNRDYTMVMGTVIVYASLLLVLNALADLAAIVIDPRVRLQEDPS